MNSFNSDCSIFLVLLRRDFVVLQTNLLSIMLDFLPVLIVQVVTFGYLLPTLGMPASMVAPVYLSSMLALFLQFGFTFAIKTAYDLKYNRFIDYHMTLAISKFWLLASYTMSQVIEMLIVSLPLYTIGIALLHNHFNLAAIHIGAAICIYLLMLLFFATFFSALAYTFSITWIMDNAWSRFLTPMWLFSSSFVLWKQTYAWSKFTAYAMLASPMTYIAEGLRSSVIGGDAFIPWYLCALALVIFISINCICLFYGIKKRLDPV